MTCALKTVGAFNASTSRYVPFRPLRICPMLRAISSEIIENSGRTNLREYWSLLLNNVILSNSIYLIL
jgi:hypothetical protein